MENIAWSRAILYPYKCEKGAQMYRIGATGFIDKIRISNIPHARLYIDDVILQDILGDTIIDIAAYMQCIYKELKLHTTFPKVGHDAAVSILKQSGNSRLDQSDKKLISVNDITIDSLMTLSRYDRRFNSLNAAKCSLSIWNSDTDNDISAHEYHANYNQDTQPRVEYSIYQEPSGLYYDTTLKYGREVIDVMQFESKHLGAKQEHEVATKLGLSSTRREVCCLIL